jgi:hypothetical protein
MNPDPEPKSENKGSIGLGLAATLLNIKKNIVERIDRFRSRSPDPYKDKTNVEADEPSIRTMPTNVARYGNSHRPYAPTQQF